MKSIKNLIVKITIGFVICIITILPLFLLGLSHETQVIPLIEDVEVLTGDNSDVQEQVSEPDNSSINDLTGDNSDVQEQVSEPDNSSINDLTGDNSDVQEQVSEPDNSSTNEWRIPSITEWLDQGNAISSGLDESWDARLHGMITPCSVIKKDGTYFLYYLGADGDRSTDSGPRNRALGLAVSTDGIHFTKYSKNPILTYLPHNNEEEGIFSAAACLDTNGNVVIYYGAMDAGSPNSESVDGDIRLAISQDGYNFQDIGDVVIHSDSSIWGYGDELFPTGAIQLDDKWIVYYIAKAPGTASGASWDIGMVWGDSKNNLEISKELLSYSTKFGSCEPILVKPNSISLFFTIIPETPNARTLEVRSSPVDSPNELSPIIQEYQFSDWDFGTIFLDKERSIWFFYYLTDDGRGINVKTAPAHVN
jgi:hypothetical protein